MIALRQSQNHSNDRAPDDERVSLYFIRRSCGAVNVDDVDVVVVVVVVVFTKLRWISAENLYTFAHTHCTTECLLGRIATATLWIVQNNNNNNSIWMWNGVEWGWKMETRKQTNSKRETRWAELTVSQWAAATTITLCTRKTNETLRLLILLGAAHTDRPIHTNWMLIEWWTGTFRVIAVEIVLCVSIWK